jgi:peptidyl-prolyl cis-trans isomerase B (cyclophilin B)
MFKARRFRLLITVGTVTAAMAVVATITAGPAGSRTQTRYLLNPPNLHVRATARTPAAAADDPCGYTAAIPADRFKGIPVFNPTVAAQPFNAVLTTTQGVITIQMLTSQAPCTTFSFRFLAKQHYFNLTHCHRLTTQGIYILQCGDPTGTGAGGPGYKFNDENLAGATYPAGTVAMANAGPNTNGSQFFFVTQDTQLSPDYTPFGTVIGGMSVLQKIAAAGDDQQNGPGDGYPNLHTRIEKVQIVSTKQ